VHAGIVALLGALLAVGRARRAASLVLELVLLLVIEQGLLGLLRVMSGYRCSRRGGCQIADAGNILW
jgi:heme A synthase